jgi:Protein of unknown function (DUF1360)
MTPTATEPRARLRQAARRIQRDYAGERDRPLGGYSVIIGAFTAAIGAAVGLGRARGTRLPSQFGVQDTVLLCVATHKASRLLAKDAVTSPIRAPFTRYEEPAGEGEVNEEVRGTGVRHAIGELLTCPFCLAVWISGGLTAGMVLAPRVTRLVTTGLTAVAASDAIQLVYDRAKPN